MQALITPPTPKYSGDKPTPSPLQEAFGRSLDYVASEMARKILEEREDVRRLLDERITEACKKALTGDAGDRITTLIADAVGTALRKAAAY